MLFFCFKNIYTSFNLLPQYFKFMDMYILLINLLNIIYALIPDNVSSQWSMIITTLLFVSSFFLIIFSFFPFSLLFMITEQLEKTMRKEFNIGDDKEVRLWNRYMTNMYEQLNKKDNTLQDAGLYQGQVIVIEQKNEDGTWPRQSQAKT